MELLSRYRPAFIRQLSIDDRYIVDLANRTARLAIEVDGGQHFDQAEYDAERTAYLESLGWRVIRLGTMIYSPTGRSRKQCSFPSSYRRRGGAQIWLTGLGRTGFLL